MALLSIDRGLLIMNTDKPLDCGALPLKRFCAWANISAPTAYKEINEGRLELRKIGKKSIILKSEADRWLNSLPVAK